MHQKYTKENISLKESVTDLLYANFTEFFVQNRVKEVNSSKNKLEKKQNDKFYKDITDISGIRIVLNRLSEMRKCIQLITTSYDIDYHNSNFNSLSFIDLNEFGYSSSHLIIVRNGIKTEVQIRTLSQHIWAVTSHDLSYKSPSKDSLFERKLFRLSGLLEQVDVLIENLYENKAISSGINYDALKVLDYYSLQYFLSRDERIFSLINICFERKRKFIGIQKHPFSMKILDGSTALFNDDKSNMTLILIACTLLKIKSPQELKQYLVDKKSNAKLIREKFTGLDLSSEVTSPALRLFLFLINNIQFELLEEHIANVVHPSFLEKIKIYLAN